MPGVLRTDRYCRRILSSECLGYGFRGGGLIGPYGACRAATLSVVAHISVQDFFLENKHMLIFRSCNAQYQVGFRKNFFPAINTGKRTFTLGNWYIFACEHQSLFFSTPSCGPMPVTSI